MIDMWEWVEKGVYISIGFYLARIVAHLFAWMLGVIGKFISGD